MRRRDGERVPDAVRANLRAIRAMLDRRGERPRAVAPGIIAVVKANAYGHGAARWRPALEEAGATMLACADIEEGVALRDAGVTRADSRVRRARASAISPACSHTA